MLKTLDSKTHEVSYIQVKAVPEHVPKRFFFMKTKQAQLKLVSTQTDLSEFDVVFFGSTVEGMMPKRKLPQEMEVYLKECQGIENKKAIVFLNAFGMAGTTLQKMTSILHTRNVNVTKSKVFTFLLNFSPEQIKEAEEFALDSTV